MQRLLHHARWDPDAVQAELQAFLVETWGHPEGIAVLDETAFVKKGDHSVGVQRQWCGTLGKTENCQVGVFLAYVTPSGQVFLDRRLYLPQGWAEDAERRGGGAGPRGRGVPHQRTTGPRDVGSRLATRGADALDHRR